MHKREKRQLRLLDGSATRFFEHVTDQFVPESSVEREVPAERMYPIDSAYGPRKYLWYRSWVSVLVLDSVVPRSDL
jgi:hypothetical protein